MSRQLREEAEARPLDLVSKRWETRLIRLGVPTEEMKGLC